MKRESKFFVVEGGDGSGKATQVKILGSRLKKEGYKVKTISFPCYGKLSCKMVEWYLGGYIYKKGEEADPKLTSMYFLYDEYIGNKKIKKWLSDGYIVVADRYLTSNKGHQMGKIKSNEERKKFLAWINDMAYKKLKLSLANTVFYLDTSLSVAASQKSKQRKEQKAKKDIYEKDLKHLKCALDGYFWVMKNDKYDKWKMVNCIADGGIMSKKDIHEEIWKIISNKL